MNISPTITPSVPDTTLQRGRLIRIASIGILAATTVNLGLYTIGRVADASLLVDPGVGTPNHHVVVSDVTLKTLIPLAIGVVVLTLIARRWPRWTNVVTAVGAVLAISTGIGPFLGAHGTTTGVLLASMHAVGGVTFVIIAKKIGRAA